MRFAEVAAREARASPAEYFALDNVWYNQEPGTHAMIIYTCLTNSISEQRTFVSKTEPRAYRLILEF